MESERFDRLARFCSTSDTRRRVLAVLAVLPLTGFLAVAPAVESETVQAAGRRHRRKKRQKHQRGDDKQNRKGKRKGKEKGEDKCRPQPEAATCAGRCAVVRNNCGRPVDCGPCICATGCPTCQPCDAATGQCRSIGDDLPCDDGDACTTGDSCQNGTCQGTPVVCPANECQDPGSCDPATGLCSAPSNKPANTSCSLGVCCGGVCQDRDCCDDDGCPGAQVCLDNGSCAIPCSGPTGCPCGDCVSMEGGGFYCVTGGSAILCECDSAPCPRGYVCDHDGCGGSMPGCVPLCT